MTQPVLAVLGGIAQANLLTDDGNVVSVQAIPSPAGQQVLPQPPATLQGNLFIDPQNVTGNAGTTLGFGTSATNPLRSWAALIALWGTTSPYLTTATTITFLSSHTDNTDPVNFSPILGKGAPCVLQGAAPAVIVAGLLLTSLAAKNRALTTNSCLGANLGGAAALGQMVINTTASKSSRSWPQRSTGGGQFQLFQPLAPQTPGGTLTPAEVDTWANGDTVNLVQPIAVNIASVNPIGLDGGAAGASRLTCYQLQVFSPAGLSQSFISLMPRGSTQIVFQECSFQRSLQLNPGSSFGTTFSNCAFLGNVALLNSFFVVGGGSCSSTTAFFCGVAASSDSAFDADAILSSSGTILFATLHRLLFGFVCFEQSITIRAASPMQFTTNTGLGYGGCALYATTSGNASTFNLAGRTRGIISGTTFTAALTAPQVAAGVLLNGQANGVTHTNAATDVINGNVATTPANADTNNVANGGIMQWGGASIGGLAA